MPASVSRGLGPSIEWRSASQLSPQLKRRCAYGGAASAGRWTIARSERRSTSLSRTPSGFTANCRRDNLRRLGDHALEGHGPSQVAPVAGDFGGCRVMRSDPFDTIGEIGEVGAHWDEVLPG